MSVEKIIVYLYHNIYQSECLTSPMFECPQSGNVLQQLGKGGFRSEENFFLSIVSYIPF